MPRRALAILTVAITTLLSWAMPVAAQTAPATGATNGQSSSVAGQAVGNAQPTPPMQTFVYIGNHDSKDVSAFRMDAVTGALSPVTGSPFAMAAGPSSIVARPDGKYLFVANELASSISTYRIDSSGALTQVSSSPVEIDGNPRELAIDPSGRYLYATTEDRDSISVFSIDASSGALTVAP